MTIAALCLALLTFTPLQARTEIAGTVVDATGLPLPGVVITIKGATTVAVTDEQGHFTIEPPRSDAVLVFALTGFSDNEIAVRTPDKDPLRITLAIAVASEQITVRAPVIGTPPDARLTLRPLDVVRTAGSQADLMRALAVLPGVAQVDEGAGLFVRGGDVSETLVLLDAVPVNHPYRYETPTGGFRGAVDPFLTQGVSFTTGGFSAEFGNSLSAVVDMRGLGRPTVPRVTATAGLAGVSGMFAQPLGSKLGVRFSANRTTPQLLFKVNPSPSEFDRLPGGWDVSASADFAGTTRGTVHFFVIDQRDHVGVELEKDAFVGFLHSGSSHRLVLGTWQRPLSGGWMITTAAGADTYTNSIDVGVFAVSTEDTEKNARVDLGGPIGEWHLRTGAEVGQTRTETIGQVPEHGGDFGGVSGASAFDVGHDDTHVGGYAEVSRTFGRITPTAGVRADRFDAADTSRIDPRINVAVDLGAKGRLRFAWGKYHQAASPDYFDAIRGSITLLPMSADHYIAGYEVGRTDGEAFFRTEAYVKQYDDLPLESDRGFSSEGYGHAHGVDIFARRVWHFIDVRASASFVSARRRWTPADQRDRYPLPDGTWAPDFAVPFTWQAVINAPVSRSVAVGFGWRTAAGHPFTPVANAIAMPSGYEPIWGPINSERLPRYSRLDLSVSKMQSFGPRVRAVFFASLDNATNRDNVLDYAYSPDYSTRRPIRGASPRTFYIGCSITR